MTVVELIELPWRECGEEEGGGFKAETPIGDYVAYDLQMESRPELWVTELWEGPSKQGEGIATVDGPDAAKKAALDHYNKVLRQMQELPANA
ncbi:MAG: hypothetical protein EVA65_15865 [Oceanococcus sp.]|nr:MAG: hypothetical protein EVA65_15865 [Oceanococcus sp.]